MLNLDSKKRKAINDIANSIKNALDLQIPVEIEKVPEMLGGTLIYEEFDDDKLEAMISKHEDNFIIQISPNSPFNRRRFSIAHELGHLFLHMGYLIDDNLWQSVGDYRDSVYYRLGHSTEEYEANEFAAAILMPEHEFKEVARANLVDGLFNITNIASEFDVSEEAATLRGRWLGIFSWGD
ncbi:ImmA/IrrE family metallo-endopeptidase [Bacillus halotolerans]|uniref:ImmA/IrrE family metallo-endopeptidase n=1 Tax=Bacillus halotolerans TaxID=260554 RepID=UPI001CB79485|nr:ImmA/IrrE family metallo-endopeptidase [Bacillus halotolerans]